MSLKQHRRRSKESEFNNQDHLEGESFPSSDWQAQRKTQQFCRQVQRALNLALSDGMASLFVEEVCPAPDCGRLLAYVVVPDGESVAEALGVLRQNASRLRAEVATAITRKRAPELLFVPAFFDGGSDE